MAEYIQIRITKCILYLTEAELAGLLAKDPALHRAALKRGKAYSRAAQTRERVRQKVEDEGGRGPPPDKQSQDS